eukprot:1447586-Amphidinium_carterae.1
MASQHADRPQLPPQDTASSPVSLSRVTHQVVTPGLPMARLVPHVVHCDLPLRCPPQQELAGLLRGWVPLLAYTHQGDWEALARGPNCL